MQGAVQKWIDHSISVTINLPNDVKEELVGELYMEAWKVGCKGVTVYRDGSRSGVLISNDEKKPDALDMVGHPKKRPKVINADVVHFYNNKEKWIAFVGVIDDKPYEIFTGLADDEEGIFLPRSVDKGVIIKNRLEDGTSRYDFQYSNKREHKTTVEGLSYKFDPEYWNYGKLISGTLRHGMPIESVVDTINGLDLNSESINTWKNGVCRALKRYIADGTKAQKGKCDACGSESLVYQEGCLSCKECGSSKCG
jgi:ribonucleoside-diphosphate reductase alpha chain